MKILIKLFIISLLFLFYPPPAIGTINNSYTNNAETYLAPPYNQAVTFYLDGGVPYSWDVDGNTQVGQTSDYFTWTAAKGHHYIHGTANGVQTTWIAATKRQMATTPVPTLNISRYNDLKNSTRAFDFPGFLSASILPFTDIVGNLFWLFVWIIIFVAYWIRQKKMTFPTVMALIFGGVIIAMLPEEYQIYAKGLIAVGIFAVLYFLFTKRSD